MSVELPPKQHVAIIVDGATSIAPDHPWVKDRKIPVVPLHVSFGSQKFPDDAPLSDFYEQLKRDPNYPQTSAPSPGEFMRAASELLKANPHVDSVVFPTISSEMSATFGNAKLAATFIDGEQETEEPRAQAVAVDTKKITVAALFPALEGADLAREGAPMDEVVDRITIEIPRVGVFAIFEQMNLFDKGGRMAQVVGRLNAALLVRPVLGTNAAGKITVAGLSRGKDFDRARTHIVEMAMSMGPLKRLAIVHTNAPELGNGIAEQIRIKGFTGEMSVMDAGAPLASHADMRATAVIYQLAS